MNKTRKITFSLSEDDYQYIKEQSQLCNMSINAYVKRKALDRTDTIYFQKEASEIMARLYDLSVKTEDLYARDQMRKYGDRLCRCIKW